MSKISRLTLGYTFGLLAAVAAFLGYGSLYAIVMVLFGGADSPSLATIAGVLILSIPTAFYFGYYANRLLSGRPFKMPVWQSGVALTILLFSCGFLWNLGSH